MLRTITIVSTDAPKNVFEADVTTVGELRKELSLKGIDFAGKSMFEGITKADYGNATNDTVLPHDLTWKGEVTNSLVFMITKAKKNIDSGMGSTLSRRDLFAKIKSLGIADSIKTEFGTDYTHLSSVVLSDFVAKHCSSEIQESISEKESVDNIDNQNAQKITHLKGAILAFIAMTVIEKLISVEEIADMLPGYSVPATPKGASNQDIEEMFASLED